VSTVGYSFLDSINYSMHMQTTVYTFHNWHPDSNEKYHHTNSKSLTFGNMYTSVQSNLAKGHITTAHSLFRSCGYNPSYQRSDSI